MSAHAERLRLPRIARDAATPPRGDVDQNPTGIGFWALVAEDFRTFDRDLLQPGLWAVLVHRFGNWRMGIRWRPARIPASVLYKVLATGILWFWGIQLEYTVKLGRRVRIWHHGGMIFGARAIGDDVHLRQNTTFGSARLDACFAKPTIGNRVDVGCGAVVLGDVHVGDDSVIGANAVVIRDVPPHSVAAGVPARIVKTLEPGRRLQD